jgi:hypothetical protein
VAGLNPIFKKCNRILHMLRYYPLLFLFVFSSCVYHRSFVATPFEPVVVKEKGDVEISAGIRPFKYYSLNMTVAPTNFLAVRLGYGGFVGLDNINLSTIFFKNLTNYGIFAAPGFNYQHNVINREIPGILFRKKYSYNCEYFSPFIAIGIRSFGDIEVTTHQLILKPQYNMVNSYSFYLLQTVSGFNSEVTNNEEFAGKIPSFFSCELTYALLKPLTDKFILKFHAGLNLIEKVYTHNYSFSANTGSKELVNRISRHPKYLGANVGVGLVFRSGRNKKRIEEN